MDVEIKQDDLNQKLLTSLAPEWIMHTIVWRNRSDLDTMSLDDLYNHLKVYEPEVQKKSDSQNMAFISSSKNSSGNKEDNTASVLTASTQVAPAGPTVAPIDEDDIEEMDIKWNMALLSMRADRFWKKTGEKIYIQGTYVAGFDKSKVKCFNCHKMGHFAKDYMANDEENHALVVDEKEPTEFALMAKTSTDNDVFDNSLCSKACLSQVEGRLVEFKNQEIKFCVKIRGLEFSVECKTNRIENLTNELETLKKEKEQLESKITGFKSASKDLDNLLESQRSDKNKEGLGLLEFADDTIIDYTRPSPSVASYLNDLQNISSSAFENGESTGSILSKPKIKFVKPADSPTVVKTDKKETVRKHTVKYAELYRKNSKSIDHLSYDCGKLVDHGRSWAKNNNANKSRTPKTVFYKTGRLPMRTNRPYMNAAQPKRTSIYKLAHSYFNRPFQRTSAVRSQFRGLRVPIVNRNFPTVNRKFPTGNSRFSTADVGNKGKADSGCSQHMTGNISYLSDYGPYDGGYVSFGQGRCKITGKGIIKTSKLEFENVYFVKDLKYNLFCVSQICDNKNNVLFTDSECIVLGRNFKLSDDATMLLRTPRQHNMYSIDLNNIVPHKDLTCLVAKASSNECMLWHRRLGYLNIKTMNRLVRHNLVRGLPSKCFENDHTCVACLKGKQHKASCKTKLVNSVTKPLYTLHMDLFGPTSVEIENLKERRVKIIRCNNGGEFRNKKMNDFCSRKGIKREFSNARTPQQNEVVERRNMTLIEAARTMLADANFLLPFGLKQITLLVMILNTIDNLGKFEAKGDEGYFIGYSMSSKAFRVCNKRTKRVEENLHVDFLENKPIEKGAGLNWLFDIDSLTNSMNYVPVVVAGTNSTNFSGTKEAAGQDVKKDTGNFNPTATSINPPADHIETLAVETLIPTVNSPVPTACLNDSPEPSSDTRLTKVAVKKVNDVIRLQALVDKKKVVIAEATIRDALRLDDVEGVECLPNEEIFTELARIGYEKPSTKLTFYKAFFSSQKQVGDLSTHTTKYTSPALTQKVFANMRRVGKGFSRVKTPLVEGMLVAHEVGEGVADEVHDEGVPAAGVATEGDVSAAHDEVPTADEEPSMPSPTPPTPPPQPSQDIPSTY
uniref:Integrase catalytic domain-containing protein n=1 Tax=Tanacetum cinerariifolium TaxID=118510 RepID=A0A6L2KJT7_TANCI|nr:hypothetical protein [Tanacetum cinerariifolium]